MHIAPFATEQYFARYEFSTPYLLGASDCETLTTGELLRLAGQDAAVLLEQRLSYTESQGDPALRAAIAALYERVDAAEVVVLARRRRASTSPCAPSSPPATTPSCSARPMTRCSTWPSTWPGT